MSCHRSTEEVWTIDETNTGTSRSSWDGPLGLAVARRLVARGDRVRVVSRTGRADVPGRVEIVAANVAEVGEAKRACDGAAVVPPRRILLG